MRFKEQRANESASFVVAKVRFLTTDEGGRRTAILCTRCVQFRPNARIIGSHSDLEFPTWLSQPAQAQPGDTLEAEWILPFSDEDPYSDFKEGAEIELYEGAKVIAKGVILSRFERTLSEWHSIRDARNGDRGREHL